jgi:signal transduction histidine kinase
MRTVLKQRDILFLRVSLAKIVAFIFIMMLSLNGFAQKQLIQIKTFDQQLKTYKNIELTINGSIAVTTDEKGSAFVEFEDANLPVQSIEVKNEGLESASWNLSKGIIEIIVRKKNYQLTQVRVIDIQQKPLAKTEIIFSGTRRIKVTSNEDGRIEIPLALDERLTSPNQFFINGYQTLQLTTSNGLTTLVIEKIKPISNQVTPTVLQKITAKRTYEKEIFHLDTVTSLSSFYAIVRNISMEELTQPQKDSVDGKFYYLLNTIQQSNQNEPTSYTISDTTRVTEDVKRLIEQATQEGIQLEAQRAEFDLRIEALNSKLKTGIVNMNQETRDRLLNDIIELEKLLDDNENRFKRNQNEFRGILNELKEGYFNISVLEEKLTESEKLRLEQEKLFNQRIIFAIVIAIILGILIIVLIWFSNRQRTQKKLLAIANDEIRRINTNLEAIVSKRTQLLQEANTELDNFLYRASHDLRTPISSIYGVISIAKFISQEEFITNIEGSVKRMDSLLTNLNVISEINQPTEKKAVSVNEIMYLVKEKFASDFKENNITPTCICDNTIRVITYPRLLEIVFFNLIENSIFYKTTQKNGTPKIDVIVTNSTNGISILVEDNGVGIDKDVKPKIYDMFFKGNEKSKGSGLGLYIVSRALRTMKGTIEVESEVNHFTRFTINLPLDIN